MTQPPKSALLPLLMRGSDDIPVDLVNEIFAEPEFSIDAGYGACCSADAVSRSVTGNDAHGRSVGRRGADVFRKQGAFVGDLLHGAFP